MHTAESAPAEALLFIIGGSTMSKTYYNSTDIYTVRDGRITWSHKGQPVPYHMVNPGVTVVDKYLIIVNDTKVIVYKTENGIFKQLHDTCCNMPALLNGLYASYTRWYSFMKVFAIGENLYVVDPLSLNMFSLNLRNIDSTWKHEFYSESISQLGHQTQAVVINSTTYIYSDRNHPQESNLFSWKPGKRKWKQVKWTNRKKLLNLFRYHHCTVSDNRHSFWIVGGCFDDEYYQAAFVIQIFATNKTWVRINSRPSKESLTCRSPLNLCVYHSGYIYVTFFNKERPAVHDIDPNFYVYDTLRRRWHTSNTTLNTLAVVAVAAIVP